MPCYGAGNRGAIAEITAAPTQVTINGSVVPNAFCTHVEDSVGPNPGKALIRIMGDSKDQVGNITLNAGVSTWKLGARVQVTIDGYDNLFLGTLVKRRDNGQSNSIIYEAWSDLWLLSKIPVRGCIVYDPVTNNVKFCSRYICRTNPSGYQNCITVSTPRGTLPVFTANAEQGQAYDNSDYDDNYGSYTVSSWTPDKFIHYLYLLANCSQSSVYGMGNEWRSLSSSDRLGFPQPSFGSTSGDMAKKMPDFTFQGQDMLSCLRTCLEMGGVWGMYGDSSNGTQTSLKFYPKTSSLAQVKVDLSCERGGDVTDLGVYDFEVDESIEAVAESVLGEGAPVSVESQFTITGGKNGDPLPVPPVPPTRLDDIKRSWTWIEEVMFARIINGYDAIVPITYPKPTPDAAWQYALFPTRQPNTDANETWLDVPCVPADGSQPWIPFARKGTKEALNIARSMLPRVWRAFEINSYNAQQNQTLFGYNQMYSNTGDYPILSIPRPVLPEQTSYYIDDAGRKTRINYPIRISVQETAGKYHDVTAQSGVHCDSMGVFFLDGLTDGVTASDGDCLWMGASNAIMVNPHNLTLKNLRINCAIQLEHRLKYVKNQSSGELDGSLNSELGGPIQMYVDSPNGFRQDHRVNSLPSPEQENPPQNDILRNDTDRLELHVSRRGRLSCIPEKRSSWYLAGIWPTIRAGTFIRQVTMVGQDGDSDYVVNAPLQTVVYDITNQRTIAGGLLPQADMVAGMNQYDVNGGTARTAAGARQLDYGPSNGTSATAKGTAGDITSGSDAQGRPVGGKGAVKSSEAGGVGAKGEGGGQGAVGIGGANADAYPNKGGIKGGKRPWNAGNPVSTGDKYPNKGGREGGGLATGKAKAPAPASASQPIAPPTEQQLQNAEGARQRGFGLQDQGPQKDYPLQDKAQKEYPLRDQAQKDYSLRQGPQKDYPLRDQASKDYPLRDQTTKRYPLLTNEQRAARLISRSDARRAGPEPGSYAAQQKDRATLNAPRGGHLPPADE